MTICGDPDTAEGPESIRAALFRVGTAVTFHNFLILGVKSLGIQMTDTATFDQVNNNTTQISTGIVAGPSTAFHAQVAPFFASGRFPNVRVNPGNVGLSAVDCARHENPEFQPSLASLAGGQMAPVLPPNDGFFEPVTFVGAVPPSPDDDWTDGWTAYPQR
jgi:hypothetical protein